MFSRLIVLVALTIGLSGCFKSDKPFITAKNADYPFTSIIYYEEGSEKSTTALKRVGDKYVDAKGSEKAFARFKKIEKNLYVVQVTDTNKSGTFHLYGLIKLAADKKSFVMFSGVAEPRDIATVKSGVPGLTVCAKNFICLSNLNAYAQYAREAMDADKGFKSLIKELE